ncbi:TonB-dependent receptor [Rapidithrix thailandica]|uniref:TonB-dependent receptor n=1 Tax=Rapidithrix thailandica TaxID=413964 RepID=A0AAW9RQ51_9BACT
MKSLWILFIYTGLGYSITMAQSGDNSPYPSDSLNVLKLDEVVVEEEAIDERSGITQFYKTNQHSSIEDILERMSGVHLIRRGNYALEPTYRGLSGGQINVTLDGMKIFGACTDKMDPATSYVETNNLHSIAIEQDNALGSSLGGNLNMKLKEPLFDRNKSWRGAISSGYHSASKGSNHALSLNFSQDRWAFRTHAVYRRHENYRNGNGEKVNFSQYNKVNISFSGKRLLKNSQMLKVDVLMDDAWDVGYPALPMDVGYARAKMGAVSYQKFFKDHWLSHIETKLYANFIRHAMDDTQRPDVPMHMDMPGQSDTYGAFVNAEFTPLRKHRLRARLEAYQNRARAEMTMYAEGEKPMFMLTWPDFRRTSASIYLEDKILLTNSLNVQLTARTEWSHSVLTEEFGKKQLEVFGYDVDKAFQELPVSASAQLEWKWATSWTSRIKAGYTQRLPTLSEQFGFYLFNRYDGYDYIGNPDIELEKSFSTELSLDYSGKYIQVLGTVYQYQIQDYILGSLAPELSAMTIGANGVKVYGNIPSAVLYGSELELLLRPTERLTWMNSLQYTYGEDNDKDPLPLIAPLKGTSSLRYHPDKFYIQMESEMATKQSRTSSKFGERTTPGYVIFHLRAAYQLPIAMQTLKVETGIENLLDKAYQQHLDWGNILRPGRNIYMNINFQF